MYFKPLTYPVKINQVQFYILSNLSKVGCYIKIFDDDGPAGGPGTLLDSPLWTHPEKGLFVQYLRAGKVPGAKTV